MSTITPNWQDDLGLSAETTTALELFVRRRRLLLVLRSLAAGVLVFVAMMLVIAVCDYLWLLSDPVRWILSLTGYALTLGSMWWFGLRHMPSDDPRRVARQLESVDPRLREDLLSAVELADPESTNGSRSFRRRLQQNMGRRTAMINVSQLLPIRMVNRWLVAGCLVLTLCATMTLIPKAQFARRFARAMLPGIAIQRASLTLLTIETPSPASTFVAQGDAVAVIVRMSGVPVEKVTLHWRTEAGEIGQTQMSPRVVSAVESEESPSEDDSEVPSNVEAADQSLRLSNLFAANLIVADEPVDYRVIAGDAITLWHTLTPLPRPKIISFEKHYRFPSYAKLDDRIETDEHGDLEAFAGTQATLSVQFDEEVDEATIHFGTRGPSFALVPVDGSRSVFRTTIPIKTPAHYQIDAVSSRSGLNNPFSPQYTITPIIDQSPMVRWAADQPTTLLVSPLQLVPFAAIATDDLPMDRMIQEFQINRQPLVQRFMSAGAPDREVKMNWDWDLMHRESADQESPKLTGGDIIRTRLVALDRLGQRGESSFIELLVADDGFDSDRHQHMESVGRLVGVVTEWTARAEEILTAAKEPLEKMDADAIATQSDASAELRSTTEALLNLVRQQTAESKSLAEARSVELIGRGLIDLDGEMQALFDSADFLIQEQHPAWKQKREEQLRRLGGTAGALSQQASRVSQLTRVTFAQEFTAAVARDSSSIYRSLLPLINESSSIPFDRFSRYFTVVTGRFNEIDAMLKRHQDHLPESTTRHFQQWTQWSDAWIVRFQELDTAPRPEGQVRALVKQFTDENKGKNIHNMFDGQISSKMQELSRDIPREIGPAGDAIDAMKRYGEEGRQARERLKDEADSERTAALLREASFADKEFSSTRDRIFGRIQREEALHRRLPSVDLQYAADMTLITRAIDNVAGEGFADYRNEPASEVLQKLSTAFKLIEGNHEAEMGHRELSALWQAERQLRPDSADGAVEARVAYPTWLERFGTTMEWPTRVMQSTGVDWKLLEPIDRTRYNEDFNQARNRITMRRWSADAIVSGESALDALQTELANGLDGLKPKVDDARETIRHYVLSLPEQAAKAAEEVAETRQENLDRKDNSEQVTEQVAEKQADAAEEVKETLEALVDFANTSDLQEQEQRELARDADAATAQIQDAMKRADEAMQAATDAADDAKRKESLEQNAAALEDLEKSLKETSNHFQRAADGEDVSESRDALRKAEEELKIAEELRQRFERAKAMADAAQSSPETLMQQLERELKRNVPMQQELSEISENAAKSAQRSLEKSARDEANVNQSLERSDAAFQESKTRAARQLANLARRATTVDQSLLNASDRAVGAAQTPEVQEKLKEARESLRSAIDMTNQMGGDQAPMKKIEQTAMEMAEAIRSAEQAMQRIEKQVADDADEMIYGDDKGRRDREARQFENVERDTRNQRSRAAAQERNEWNSLQRDSDRRVQQAQRQAKDAERQKQQTQERLDREKNDNNKEAIEKQIAEIQSRIEQFERAEQAARESSDFAKERANDATERERELGKQKLENLNQANPGAELAQRLAEKAAEEFKQIGEELKSLADLNEAAKDLRAPTSHTQSLVNQQQQIASDVDDASQQLQRASRHEKRLGKEEQSESLMQAANSIDDTALKAAENATDSIQDASQQNEKSADANEKIQTAQKSIADAAESLSELLGGKNEPEGSNAPPSSSPSPTEQRAKQLAQTLDELDQAMASSPNQSQGENGEGQQGEGQQGEGESDQQSSQSADSQGSPSPGKGSPGGKPSSAAQASPTLASLMEAQAQAAARQRQQQIDPSSMSDGQSPEGPPKPSSSRSAISDSNSGEMPEGGTVDSRDIDRSGGQWGSLREQRTDNAAESSAPGVPPQYRREIEAYFRAIARQAAEKE